MTKIKNTKKGMAKKTLSMSLVVAMLATSNVPVWAAEFSDGTDPAVATETPAVETFADETAETPVVEDLFVGLLQFGLRLVEHTDREEAAYQCLVLLKDFLLELVQFLVLYLDGPAHAGIASINVDIAGDPLAQPSVPLKENHLVHDVVVRQVHPKPLQHRMVQ